MAFSVASWIEQEVLSLASSQKPSIPEGRGSSSLSFLVKSLQYFMGGSVSVILICIVKTVSCTEVQGD